MRDKLGRKINYMRISVTDRCNLFCLYCKKEKLSFKPPEEILRYEEILRVARIAISLGISKIRITGGEPLVRKGITGFVSELSSLPGLEDISLTTNGILLAEFAKPLYKAGLKRINVSLDTLKREKFKDITGEDEFGNVWKGIENVLAAGMNPVKINVVLLKGINEDEAADFVALTKDERITVRFIELMPLGIQRENNRKLFVSLDEVLKNLKNIYEMKVYDSGNNLGPATYYRVKNCGLVGFIGSISGCFCGDCNRLRLTASGYLKPCLWSDKAVNIKEILRAGAPDAEIAEILRKAIREKPAEREINKKVSFPMSEAGG
ncbi:MAG: GTP 3',8-cyclase MoaA [Firmicutes bacterium]|nr:GTP 3',8-cyclase MoaA [Bacillota bacterium]